MNSMTRETAIAQIRRALIAMQEEGHSVCKIAAEKGILCRGFSRDTDEELRWRYAAARMNMFELHLSLDDKKEVWSAERLAWNDVADRRGPYTI